jgi:hypothetical protein
MATDTTTAARGTHTSEPSTKPGSFTMPPLSAEHQATAKVAARLVELCARGENLAAIQELYADHARHVEVVDGPGCGRILEGKTTIAEKAAQFARSITVHGRTCGAPVVNGDQFLCPMSLDCTFNEGPMAGQRMNMTETVLYTVRNGTITEAKFFYAMCG